jgi:CheY-like chemotaxis protein
MSSRDLPRVLVVEDEPLLRSLASAHLRDQGFQVMEAAAATDALALLEQHPEIDVLFTDVNMPGPIDGLGLVKEVRRVRPDLPLVMTSGQWAAKSGDGVPDGVVFLHKPYPLDQVAQLMKALAKAN